jgi:hypothetical protein
VPRVSANPRALLSSALGRGGAGEVVDRSYWRRKPHRGSAAIAALGELESSCADFDRLSTALVIALVSFGKSPFAAAYRVLVGGSLR